MSLVTLSSSKNTATSSNTSPSIIKNYFKEGLVLREGTEVCLVSLTINKLDLFEIIEGDNDTLVWRIGNSASFDQHTVTISAGNYNGEQLAKEIQEKLNNSVIIGLYYNQWTCVFDQTLQAGKGGFTIDYGQNETPAAANANTYIGYAGATPSFTSNGTPSVTMGGSAIGRLNDFKNKINPTVITGNKGIFPNEGNQSLIIRPQQGYSLTDQSDALKLQTITETYYELGIPETRDLTFVDTTGVPLTNGWLLKADTTPVVDSLFWTYLGDGEWGVSEDGTYSATRQNILDNGGNFLFYNPSREVFADADNGGRHTEISAVGSIYSYTAAPFLISIALSNVGYGSSCSGYVRNYLYNGRDDYPANTNAEIKADQNNGYDVMINCVDNDTEDGIEFNLSQLKQTQGTSFPDANWRTASVFIFENIDPLTEFNTLPTILGTAPTNWSTFTYGTDHIRMRVEIDNIVRVNVYLSHDTAGDGDFSTNEILVRRTGDANGFNTTIQEKLFPLRPCVSVSGGNNYQPSRYILEGIFDEVEIVNPTVYSSLDDVEIADESEFSLTASASVPANALTLSALYKFGETYQSDVPPSGTLPQVDLIPSGSINNILGLNRYYVFAAGNASNSVTSSSEPITTIREPTLSLELTDFNIKGSNGTTGDSMKVIAVIPKEELQTNEKTGTLHYYPAFPVFIDLNLPQETIFYDLNAILRLPSGRVANDLVNPTEMTLLFREGEESKQKRMLKQQSEMLASMIGNIQSTKINNIGNEFPRI